MRINYLSNLWGALVGRQADAGGRPGNGSDFWFGEASMPATAGVRVTAEGVMTGEAATVFACVRILAESVSVAPLKVYEVTANDTRREAKNHPVYRLMRERPNAYQTPSGFMQYLVSCLLLRGNYYAYKRYDGAGNLAALQPLAPAAVRVKLLDTGMVRYEVYDAKKGWTFVPAEYILHVKNGVSGDSGVTGLSVLQAGKDTVGNAVAAERFAARSFKNGAMPGVAITHPDSLSDEARARMSSAYMSQFGGDNLGRPFVADSGISIEKLSLSNEDAQLLESRKFSREEIAMMFRTPLFLLSAAESGASYANLEQIDHGYLTYTLLPIFTAIEEAITSSLILNTQRFFCEFNTDVYQRVDIQKRTAAYNQAWWLTGNEIRRKENLAPVDDPMMDKVQPPLNRGNPGGAATTPNNSNNSPGAMATVLDDAAGRVVRAEKRELVRLADKHEDAAKFLAAATRFYEAHEAYMVTALGPVATAFDVPLLHVQHFCAGMCKTALAALSQSPKPQSTPKGWSELEMQAAVVESFMKGVKE